MPLSEGYIDAMEQYEHSFPFRPYVVGAEAFEAPPVMDILGGRDTCLTRQLVDHNIFLLKFNATAGSQPTEGLAVLADNTCKVSRMLDEADGRLVERLDVDLRGHASSDISPGEQVRNYVRELLAERIAKEEVDDAYRDRLAAVLGESFSAQEIDAVAVVFGDEYIWERIQQARHEPSLVRRVDAVGAFLACASRGARRAIHSAADGLFASWLMGDFDTRSARRYLIDALGSSEETRRLLERHFVSTRMYSEVTKGGRIRWLPVVSGAELEVEARRGGHLDGSDLRVIDGELST